MLSGSCKLTDAIYKFSIGIMELCPHDFYIKSETTLMLIFQKEEDFFNRLAINEHLIFPPHNTELAYLL